MENGHYTEERWAFIEKVQGPFVLQLQLNQIFSSQSISQELPYPIWKHRRDLELVRGSHTLRLAPLSALLTYAEQHLIARYKYITVTIGGRKIFSIALLMDT